MKTKPLILFVSLLILALGAGWYFLIAGDDDEKIINRNLGELVALAEKEGDEAFFVAIRQAREMIGYFSEEPSIEFGSPLPVVNGREELQGVIIQVRQGLQNMRVRVIRSDLTVAEGGESAVMELEAEGNVTYSGDNRRERRRFSVDWVKEEGDWLIQTVRLENEQ